MPGPAAGSSTSVFSGDDREESFASPDELWSRRAGEAGARGQWYSKSVGYWDQQEPSYNGVLGGFGHVSDIDVADSRQLLQKAFKSQLEEASTGARRLVAADCGAGVGRVSEQLLLHYFAEVDLIEPSQHLLNKAKEALSRGVGKKFPKGHAPAEYICKGLQEFVPTRRYDCIWVQWCLLYLTDDDTVQFLIRSKGALMEDGLIVVKENICHVGFVVDNDDNGITRSHEYMLQLFCKAQLTVVYSVKQKKFPKGLYPVRMYVLRPQKE